MQVGCRSSIITPSQTSAQGHLLSSRFDWADGVVAAVRRRSLQELTEETEEMRGGVDSHKKAQKRAKRRSFGQGELKVGQDRQD